MIKMSKALYRVCKIINWAIPIFIVVYGFGNGGFNKGYSYYAFIGIVIFVLLWAMYSSSRSRLLYQSAFFAGLIIGLYNTLTPQDTVFEKLLSISSDTATGGEKILILIVTATAFLSKICTMIYETKEYNAGWIDRHNNRLDDAIDSAAIELGKAQTREDIVRAEAKLERAKLNKERKRIEK